MFAAIDLRECASSPRCNGYKYACIGIDDQSDITIYTCNSAVRLQTIRPVPDHAFQVLKGVITHPCQSLMLKTLQSVLCRLQPKRLKCSDHLGVCCLSQIRPTHCPAELKTRGKCSKREPARRSRRYPPSPTDLPESTQAEHPEYTAAQANRFTRDVVPTGSSFDEARNPEQRAQRGDLPPLFAAWLELRLLPELPSCSRDDVAPA